MGPTWGPPGADRTQMGPMWAAWTLLSGISYLSIGRGYFLTNYHNNTSYYIGVDCIHLKNGHISHWYFGGKLIFVFQIYESYWVTFINFNGVWMHWVQVCFYFAVIVFKLWILFQDILLCFYHCFFFFFFFCRRLHSWNYFMTELSLIDASWFYFW